MARLCFRPEDEDKLAKGWPNLVVPVDGRKEDKAPAKAALKAWSVSDPIHFTEWPRKTLHRYVRAADPKCLVHTADEDAGRTMKAFETDGEPSPNEVLGGLRGVFERGWTTYPFRLRDFVYGAETIAGTDAVIGAISGAVQSAKWPTPPLGLNHLCRATIVECCAFLTLRASPAAAKDARAKLEGVLSSGGDDVKRAYSECFETLDYVTNGAAGVKRILAASAWVGLEVPALATCATLDFAADDPDYVREMVLKAEKKEPMSVRVAWIGGPPVLEGLALRKWPAAQLPSIVRDFGMLRDPAIVTLMLSLVGKSSVKDAPLVWFREHAEYARPILAKHKDAAAKMVLRQL